jgi:hypothetical protein
VPLRLLLCLSLLVACQAPPAYPELEVDLSPMGLLPVLAGGRPPMVDEEQAIDRLETQAGHQIEVVSVGRRWARGGATIWVVVYRPHYDPACAGCWIAWTVNDQTGVIVASFDAASLRAFGITLPDW